MTRSNRTVRTGHGFPKGHPIWSRCSGETLSSAGRAQCPDQPTAGGMQRGRAAGPLAKGVWYYHTHLAFITNRVLPSKITGLYYRIVLPDFAPAGLDGTTKFLLGYTTGTNDLRAHSSQSTLSIVCSHTTRYAIKCEHSSKRFRIGFRSLKRLRSNAARYRRAAFIASISMA